MSEPRLQAERFGSGEEASVVAPGDMILTHRPQLIPRLIRLAERRRFRGVERPFAHWSHAALVVDAQGTLVEAESTGVQRSPLSRYRDREYHLVRTSRRLREHAGAAVRYADSAVGEPFGFLALLSLGVWLLTGIPVHWLREDHQICSGLVARALAEGGESFDRDPSFTLPADLARKYGVRP